MKILIEGRDSWMQKVILIGDGGHSKVVEDCILASGDIVLAKLDERHRERFMDGDVVKGPIAILPDLFAMDVKICVAIEQNEARKQIVDLLNIPAEVYATVVHPSATIGRNVTLGFGTVVMPGVVINTDAKIGEHVIVNSNSTVEYDCVVEDFVHIASGAVMVGSSSVGIGAVLGASATITSGKRVGDWTTVSAGSVVMEDMV